MEKIEKKDFNDCLDTIFMLNQDAWEDHGEDSYYCARTFNSAIMGVFDGCGGLGSRAYESFKGRTSAYIASRAVSGAVHDWYHNNYDKTWVNSKKLVTDINLYIKKAFEICKEYAVENIRIRGTMVRDFPTTMAMVYAENSKEGIIAHIIWAGDSRVYLMDENGLAQLTVDDTDVKDAFENISSDGVLNNLLSSDGKYKIHCRSICVQNPFIIFAATDGCFNYIPTPMEFEYLILKTMVTSQNPEKYRRRLKESFEAFAGDDFSFGFMSFQYGDFDNTRKAYEKRVRHLEEVYVKELKKNLDKTAKQDLWEDYKPTYERYLR